MNAGLIASVLGVGVFSLAAAAHAQAPAPPSSAAFAPASAAPTPAPAAPAASAEAPPAPIADAPAPVVVEPAPTPAPSSSALAAPSPAETPPPRSADEPEPATDEPGSGLGLIIAGWSVTGLGALNLLTIPVCKADFYPHDQQDLCVDLSVAVGVIGLGVGIPMLIVGYNHRAKHAEWQKHHAVLDGLLHTQVALQNNSAFVVYRGTF